MNVISQQWIRQETHPLYLMVKIKPFKNIFFINNYVYKTSIDKIMYSFYKHKINMKGC